MWKRFDIRKELWILQHERPSPPGSFTVGIKTQDILLCRENITCGVRWGARPACSHAVLWELTVSRGALGGHKDSVAFAKPSTVKWASPIPQLVKNPPSMHEPPIRFLSWEDLLEKG